MIVISQLVSEPFLPLSLSFVFSYIRNVGDIRSPSPILPLLFALRTPLADASLPTSTLTRAHMDHSVLRGVIGVCVSLIFALWRGSSQTHAEVAHGLSEGLFFFWLLVELLKLLKVKDCITSLARSCCGFFFFLGCKVAA